jgi:hypothetical protein
VRQFLREDYPWGRTIEQLDRVSRAMNPVLLFIAVSLVVLNLACVVNLIDWGNLQQQAAATGSTLPSAAPGQAHGKAAPASN